MALLGSAATVEHSLENYFEPDMKKKKPNFINFNWAIFTIINWTVFYALNQIQ